MFVKNRLHAAFDIFVTILFINQKYLVPITGKIFQQDQALSDHGTKGTSFYIWKKLKQLQEATLTKDDASALSNAAIFQNVSHFLKGQAQTKLLLSYYFNTIMCKSVT